MNFNIFVILGILIFVPIHKLNINKKIIIYLLLLILFLKNNEGFGNIDAEALQNMASLYNSSTGILKVNNIEASGNITATGYGEFGNAYIGNLNQAKGYATFCHKDNKAKDNAFSLIQNSPGYTALNGATGQGIDVKINNNIDQGFKLDKDGNIIANRNVTATGYGEFGDAFVGNWASHPGGGYAAFCHKDFKGNGANVAIFQEGASLPLAGKTYLNSSGSVEVRTKGTGLGNMELNQLTLSGACEADVNDSSDNVNQPAPIKLTNDKCHWKNFTNNVAIGGKAFVPAFVEEYD